MPTTPKPAADSVQIPIYHIRVKGHLSPRWETWFDRMTITEEANGDTVLAGPVVDQAALHGLLRKVRDLGLPLLSITRVEPGHDEPMTHHRKETE